MCCSVSVSVCLACCVFDSACKLHGETWCLVVGAIMLLNVMEVFSVGEGALLDRV